MTRCRGGAVLLAALLLGGCTSGGNSDYQAYLQVVRQSLHQSFGSGGVTRAAAAAVPFASMGIRLGDAPESLLVLASDTNGDQLWTSKSNIVLLTRNGRIHHTVGLHQNLSALSATVGSNLNPALALKNPAMNSLSADFADIGVYAAAITCRMAAQRQETIVILGKAISTIRVDEACRSPSLRWNFTNQYWVDPESGFVWRTQQHVHPRGDILRTEIFRPPE